MEAVASARGMSLGKTEKVIINEERIVKNRMNLLEAETGKTYAVKEINTEDEEMNAFLFRLGCYSGEPITIM